MPTIERDGVEIFYEQTGHGHPVVFLHGWTMDHELWDRQVTALAPKFQCVTVDLRGHGASSKPLTGYSYDDHASDVRAVIDRLEADHVTLVGSSMGGSIAVRVAASEPGRIDQVVTVGCPPQLIADEHWPEGRPAEVVGSFVEHQRVARETTMRQIVADSVYSDIGEATEQWLFHLALRSPSWAAIGSWEGALASSVVPDISELKVPLLVIHGVHDRFVSNDAATRLAATAHNGRLEWFHHSGHFPFLEETERFNDVLTSFLLERGRQ